jgi:hypothetical protein
MLKSTEEDGRWYLITTGMGGRMKAIPVVSDDEIGFMPTVVVPVGDTGAAGMN